ncbi:MAG: RnfABCDGE type electron transport complex subunit B [Acutalibacteraceae bacterium]
MNEILLPILLVAGIGLLLGLGLAVASKVMAVPVDEKAEAITAVLPGANCGACGFSGCAGYAAALSSGKTEATNLCAPGGTKVAGEVAGIMGTAPGKVLPTTAVVMCCGDTSNSKDKMIYKGVSSCRMASQLFGGAKECSYGCLGLGDCVDACPFDAIHICDGIARVNTIACHSCRACVNTCPKHLIEMLPLNVTQAAVLCKNHEKGAQAKKHCNAACIGCMKCMKACEHGAVKVENFLASVDPEKCIGCGKCHEVCPVGCIGLITPKGE